LATKAAVFSPRIIVTPLRAGDLFLPLDNPVSFPFSATRPVPFFWFFRLPSSVSFSLFLRGFLALRLAEGSANAQNLLVEGLWGVCKTTGVSYCFTTAFSPLFSPPRVRLLPPSGSRFLEPVCVSTAPGPVFLGNWDVVSEPFLKGSNPFSNTRNWDRRRPPWRSAFGTCFVPKSPPVIKKKKKKLLARFFVGTSLGRVRKKETLVVLNGPSPFFSRFSLWDCKLFSLTPNPPMFPKQTGHKGLSAVPPSL